MYLGYQNDKIKFYTEQPLDQVIYNLSKVVETQDEYVLIEDEYVLKNSDKEIEFNKNQKILEINNKIKELQQMSLKDIRLGNEENIKIYNSVISGLETTRDNL